MSQDGGEKAPLVESEEQSRGRQDQRIALGITAALLIVTAIASLPPFVHWWHHYYFRSNVIEGRAWAWFGINSLWLAVALVWTLVRKDNAPATAVWCFLCALFYAYLDVVVITQWARGQLKVWVVFDFLIHTALLIFCARAAWEGVIYQGHHASTTGSTVKRRMIRKWVLVASSLQLFVAFLACWPVGSPFSPPKEGREQATWEWNAAVLFTEAVAVLWGAFLMHGGFVDETKQAMCVWCALIFAGAFALSSFSWPTLGMVGHNVVTSVVLAVDVVVLAAAAVA